MREAPAIALIERLLAAGALVQAFDRRDAVAKALRVGRDLRAAQLRALAARTRSPWSRVNEFREPDFARSQADEDPRRVRRRNIYSRELMRANGFTYYSIGR